ncbi:MAG: phosphopentomutase [Clostridia bacterium]|nr:phosphopentomutase [Clostridia bacterium]
MNKRVFLIVLDSFGIGEMPDAEKYNDKGSNTLLSIRKSEYFNALNLINLGLFNIDGVGGGVDNPSGAYGRIGESSNGKDTTVGHWEIAGIVSKKPLPTYPNGFPKEVISKFEELTGKKVLCNKPYSGTEVIKDYGKEHIKTGDLIVYTSQDSVFQIASHEDVVPVKELYRYCEIARELLIGEHSVGRVIARPFTGEYPFVRTANRHDYSLLPPSDTMLNYLKNSGYDVISVGKINDIFASSGITESYKTKDNLDGINKTIELTKKDFNGLCFINLVDFDSKYGHRNDVDGYAKAISEFDEFLPNIIKGLNSNDILIITADHGCDPSTKSTDHSREYVPILVYGNTIKGGVNLKTRDTFSDIAKTILEYFNITKSDLSGSSFLNLIKK